MSEAIVRLLVAMVTAYQQQPLSVERMFQECVAVLEATEYRERMCRCVAPKLAEAQKAADWKQHGGTGKIGTQIGEACWEEIQK